MAHLINKEKAIGWLKSKCLGVSASNVKDIKKVTIIDTVEYVSVVDVDSVLDGMIARNLLSEVTSLMLTEYTR